MLNAALRCRLQTRLFNSYFGQVLFREASSSSDKTPSEKIHEKRNRKLEPGITKGEVWSRANIAPQVYDTSMEDNYQRTTVTPIWDEMHETKRNYISTYSEIGFVLHDETMLFGPVALFPKTFLSWRVPTVDDITPESMLLFTVIEPKLDIVVVGVGDKKNIRAVKERLQPLFRKNHVLLEVLDTPEACSTFNFLNKDGRYVAAALFPALHVDANPRKLSGNLDAAVTIRKGWFGFSDFESQNPIEDAKKYLEDSIRRRNEREGPVEGPDEGEKAQSGKPRKPE